MTHNINQKYLKTEVKRAQMKYATGALTWDGALILINLAILNYNLAYQAIGF